MSKNLAHQYIVEANSQPMQSTDDSCCIGRNRPQADVGLSQWVLTQCELDDAITELLLAADSRICAGDIAGAYEYSRRMVEAVRSRTVEHQTRLEAQRWDEMTLGGEWAMELARRNG